MNIIIKTEDHTPIYEQIVQGIKKALIKKELSPGEMLPSIRLLAKDLEVSVITTKRAYEELEKEGLIYSEAGKGFYVKAPDRERMREQQLRRLEEKLAALLKESRELGLTLEDMKSILETLEEGGES